MIFYYTENNKPCSLEISPSKFDTIIDDIFDTSSAILLGISIFINNHIYLLHINTCNKDYLSFSYLALKLSLPSIYCYSISDVPNNNQLNIEVRIDTTDEGYIKCIAILIALITYEQFNTYKQYYISFKNIRMLTSWIRFKNNEIKDMSYRTREFADVLLDVINRDDCVIFEPSTEKINLNEIKYFYFPNYKTEKFSIKNIQESSIPDRKRLRANLFIGEINDKTEIIDTINDAISWLKTLKNLPTPQIRHKNGEMEADSLYINVYKNDLRKNMEISVDNNNFLCFVDYNIDGITTLKHGGILESVWKKLYHEKYKYINISWRERKYFTIFKKDKVGRNDACPCNSGKKFKKCCIDKGIYN